MSLRRFLAYDPLLDRAGLLALLVVLALAYPTVALVIAAALSHAVEGPPTTREVALFGAATALLVIAFTLVMLRAVHAVERAAYGSRADLIRGLAALELPEQERIGGDEIYFNTIRNVRNVSDATFLLSKLVAVCLGTIGSLVVMAFVSFQAAMILLLMILLLAAVYLPNLAFIRHAQDDARTQEQGFFRGIEDVLSGFKELKLHAGKADQLFEQVLNRRAQSARAARVRAGVRAGDNYVLQVVLLIGAAGVFLTVMPLFYPDQRGAGLTAAFFTLFLPAGILLQVPVFLQAQTAVSRLFVLKDQVRAGARPIRAEATPRPLREIALAAVSYRYGPEGDVRRFQVGPLSLTLPAGSLTFIVGGNGSGKSTLIKVLTGLYPTQTGRILLNGQAVDMAGHRGAVSAVFTDSHLFERLYGLVGVADDRLNRLLAALGLEGKLRVQGGRFSSLDLSSGQRKRVALAVALLEDKPVWVLDEWAADQDPEFRAVFYRTILPVLKAHGRTVVVVSHDDRYFDVADRILRMEDGQIVEDRPGPAAPTGTAAATPSGGGPAPVEPLDAAVLAALEAHRETLRAEPPQDQPVWTAPGSDRTPRTPEAARPSEPGAQPGPEPPPRRLALFDLLRQAGQEDFVRLIAWTSLAALGQIAAVALLGARAGLGPDPSWTGWAPILLFTVCLAVTGLAIHQMLRAGIGIAEAAGTRLSVALAQRVRASELRTLESIGANAVFTAASRDAGTVAVGCVAAVNTLLVLGLLLAAMTLLLLAAPAAAIVLACALALNLAYFRATEGDVDALEAEADRDEARFAGLTLQAVRGFKDLKMDPRRARDLIERDAIPAAQEVLPSRVTAAASAVRQFNVVVFLFFGAVAGIGFVLPQFGFGGEALFAGLIVLYLFQYLGDLVGYQQQLKAAAAALGRIRNLEARLGGVQAPERRPASPLDSDAPAAEPGAVAVPTPTAFSSLSLQGVGFQYRDRTGVPLFGIGPLDLTLPAGQILLIAGGNGAGKSTLLRVLTGLYPTETGDILLDGRRPTRDRLRALFATVFTDFHLFDRLYGVGQVDPERVGRLLERLLLSGKVTLREGAFSTTTALSTGQRKRLALIAAVLEDRPVLIFDEWTADQDPEFREIFYSELLPELKEAGRTVIAVTHDDRYFDRADRLIRMRRGQIVFDSAA